MFEYAPFRKNLVAHLHFSLYIKPHLYTGHKLKSSFFSVDHYLGTNVQPFLMLIPQDLTHINRLVVCSLIDNEPCKLIIFSWTIFYSEVFPLEITRNKRTFQGEESSQEIFWEDFLQSLWLDGDPSSPPLLSSIWKWIWVSYIEKIKIISI